MRKGVDARDGDVGKLALTVLEEGLEDRVLVHADQDDLVQAGNLPDMECKSRQESAQQLRAARREQRQQREAKRRT
jgi:formylmethanofuran dehydrogenase subunit E